MENDVIMTSLQYAVCCISYGFSYEYRHFAQQWTMHNWPQCAGLKTKV